MQLLLPGLRAAGPLRPCLAGVATSLPPSSRPCQVPRLLSQGHLLWGGAGWLDMALWNMEVIESFTHLLSKSL